MARTLPPVDQIVNKLVQNTAAAVTAYTNGVNRVKTAPGAAAAQAKDAYLNGINQNVNKWANNVAKVSLTDWQQAAINKGAGRLGTGIQNAVAKATAFWNRFAPVLQTAINQVSSMPKSTYEQRKARANAMMDALHQFKNM